MKRPTITIEGKTYELQRPKGVAWRKLLETDKNTREVFSEDFIENRCAYLALAFGDGLTEEYLLNNMYLDEIMQAYREAVNYYIGQIVAPKLEKSEKNGSAGDTTIQ